MIPVIQAIDEIARYSTVGRMAGSLGLGYPIEIVRALCSGEEVETPTHTYRWEISRGSTWARRSSSGRGNCSMSADIGLCVAGDAARPAVPQ